MEKEPSDERRGTSEPLSPERREVEQLVIEGLAEAVKQARIDKQAAEERILAYKKLARIEKPPTQED